MAAEHAESVEHATHTAVVDAMQQKTVVEVEEVLLASQRAPIEEVALANARAEEATEMH